MRNRAPERVSLVGWRCGLRARADEARQARWRARLDGERCWNDLAARRDGDFRPSELMAALIFAARRGVVVHAATARGAEEPFALQAARLYAHLQLTLRRGDVVDPNELAMIDDLVGCLPRPWSNALRAAANLGD